MRKIGSFFWYQNLWKFEKNLMQSDRAPLIKCNEGETRRGKHSGHGWNFAIDSTSIYLIFDVFFQLEIKNVEISMSQYS